MSTPNYHEFQSDRYDDPSREWICGGIADGLPCTLGPSHRGECRAVCTPIREGNRYYCNNASVLAGACDEGPLADGECCQVPPLCTPSKLAGQWVCNRGKCQEGPLPDGTCNMKFMTCRPARGVLARRRAAVVMGFGLAVGCLLILTGSTQRQAAVSPGGLASHHQTASGCVDCHAAGEGDLVELVHAAFAAHADSAQSDLCLKCHVELGDNAEYAHGIAPQSLAKTTENIDQSQMARSSSLMLSLARAGRPTANQNLACATCHEEHRGKDYDMTQMGDLQCQVCHKQTFDSFAKQHPDFASYPYRRRTQIHFNHRSHYQIHFANFERTSPLGTAPSDEQGQFNTSSSTCTHCHVPDGVGNAMQLRGFDQSCGGCHSEQITDLQVRVVSIPEKLFEPATAGDEREISNDRSSWIEKHETGIMRLMLANDPEIRTARDSLLNWRKINETENSANAIRKELDDNARQYAAGVKKRIAELLDAQPTNAAEAPEQVAEPDLYHGIRSLVPSSLSSNLSRADRQKLLRMLAGDVTSVDDTGEDETGEEAAGIADRNSIYGERIVPSSPRWSLRNENGASTLVYQPQGHADRVLKNWLESAASHSSATSATKYARGESVSAWEQMFAELSGLVSPGRCMKCHTANEKADDHLQVAWAANGSDMGVGGFTDFVHAPHLLTRQNQDCTSCHSFAEQLTDKVVLFQPEFIHPENTVNTNPNAAESSGFAPLQKSDCAECHQPTMARDNCLTCHNYHVHSRDHRLPQRSRSE